jgi:hypothetical protein
MAGLGAPKAPTKYVPKYKPYTPPATIAQPYGTTQGLTNYTGYEGPGVQDLINQGKIGWNQGMGNIGYQPPAFNQGQGGVVWDYGAGAGGGAPDYGALIGGDYEVQAAESAMAARMARARGDYTADIRQAFIDLGLSDTSKVGEYGKAIDAETMKAAANNKYSMTAQIAQAAEKGRATNNAALAARGILSSGQTTKSQTDVTAAAEKGRYEALRDFLSGALQGKRSLADLNDQLAQNVAMARAAAAQRAAEMAWYNRPAPLWPGGDTPWSGVPGSNDYDYSQIPDSTTWFPPGFNALAGPNWLAAAKKATGQKK